MADLPVLWHIEISHYNEKVRWALDLKGVEHVRKAPLPGPHALQAALMTRGKVHTFPVMRLDGKRIGDSTAIIAALEERYPEPPLYPADPEERRRALEIEDYFDEQVAPEIRRVAFHHLLQDPKRAAKGIAAQSGAMRERFLRSTFFTVRAFMRVTYGVNGKPVAESQRAIDAALDRIAAETAETGYFVGDRFTVADLTAASIVGGFIAPDEYKDAIRDIPESLKPLRDAARAHPGGQWVLEMFAKHRSPSAAVAA